MAPKISTNLYIISMLYLIMKHSTLIHGQPQVPCLFFLGDSLLDNGNNNFLNTRVKVNHYPYGIDYPGGIGTGRFSNGKTMADILAELLGFEESIPPFATVEDSEILKGVNYGSGGSGILDETGYMQGGWISMNRQLSNHETTISKIAFLLGNTTLSEEHLNKCLYVVSMGSNDYLNNYLKPMYNPRNALYTPQEFAAILTHRYSEQLWRLYNNGARKVAVYGVGLIGCVPEMLSPNPTNGSYICSDSINQMVHEFNDRLKTLIDTLNINLHGAQFIYINFTGISSADTSALGFRVVNAPCCQVMSQTGLCDVTKEPCNDRDEYLFWDNYHLSEKALYVVTERAYTALLPSDTYPIDISHLVENNNVISDM